MLELIKHFAALLVLKLDLLI